MRLVNNALRCLLALACALGCENAVAADAALPAPLTIQKKIKRPLRVFQLLPVRFGTVAAAAPGTVTIDERTGARTMSGGVAGLGGFYERAAFEVIGEPNELVTILLPESVPLSGDAGVTMTLLRSEPGGVAALSPEGRLKIHVGATLRLPGVAARGARGGVFPIHVEYINK